MESFTKERKPLSVDDIEEAAKAEIEKTKSDKRNAPANVLLNPNRPVSNEELNDALNM